MSDVKLTDNAVVIEGNLGIGTSSPAGLLHVEGSEVLSTGPVAGYSFAERSDNNKRWVWYADQGFARLWGGPTGSDALQISPGQLLIDSVKCKRLYADHIIFGTAEGVLAETLKNAPVGTSAPGIVYSGESIAYGNYTHAPGQMNFVTLADVIPLLLALQARVAELEKAVKK